MSIAFGWDFGIRLSNTYYSNSSWDLSHTNATMITDDTTPARLRSPASGTSPGDQAVLYTGQGREVTTEEFVNIATGFVSVRVGVLGSSGSFLSDWLMIRNATTEVMEVRAGATPSAVRLYMDGSLIATSSTSPITNGDFYWLTLKFDVSSTTWTGTVYVDGVEVIPQSSSVEPASTNINRVKMGAGNSEMTWNTLLVWNSHSANDEAEALNVNIWSVTLQAVSIANDSDWTVFGGPGTKMAALTDYDGGTGVATTIDGASIDVNFQNRGDVLAGWAPTNIYMMQAVVFGSSDVLQDVNLTFKSGGTLDTTNYNPLPASPDFVRAMTTTDAVGSPISGPTIDLAEITYDVNS